MNLLQKVLALQEERTVSLGKIVILSRLNSINHFLLILGFCDLFIYLRACSLSPNARISRISSLENMLSISSNSLVSMASQLSEAEERERGFANRGRWNHLRSMADAKNLLQYMFNSFVDSR